MDKVSIKKEVDEDNPYSVEPTRSGLFKSYAFFYNSLPESNIFS